MVHLHVAGAGGGDWSVQRNQLGWQLYQGGPTDAAAHVNVDQAVAWRLYTKGLTPAEAQVAATITGDPYLGRHLLKAVAIIA